MESITLEQAQRYYIVPWIIDRRDLRIINYIRGKYNKWCMEFEKEIYDKLWKIAQTG